MLSLTILSSLTLGLSSPVTDFVRECDVAASHPDDPDKVAPGWEREEINLAEAEKQCLEAYKQAPERARTAYHLGRVIYYQGRHLESLPYLQSAADAGYPQAIFVLGYVHSVGGKVPRDLCKAQKLWLRSAAQEHPWSAYHLVIKHLDGAFKACTTQIGNEEIGRLLDLALAKITFSESAGRLEKLTARFAE